MWVKILASSGTSVIFFSINQAQSTSQALHIGRRNTNKITFAFYGNDVDTNTTTITDSNWHHYVFTYNKPDNARVIYIDGSADTTNTASGPLNVSSAEHIKLGTNVNNNDDLNGSMYDFRIYSKALSATEVSSIYTRSYQGYMDDIRVYNVALSPNELKQVYFNTNTYDISKI